MFRREFVERLTLFNGPHRFLPTLVKLEGFRVIELSESLPQGCRLWTFIQFDVPAHGQPTIQFPVMY